jgi:GntR family transcriptional regulator/MocR family aminotransferase
MMRDDSISHEASVESLGHESLSPRVLNFVRLAEAENGQPLHERLYQRLRALIVNGTLAHGSKVPPSRVLAETLGISRNSVLNALDRLIADGWLESRRGSGVFVAYEGVPARDAAAHKPVPRRPETVPFQAGVPPLDLFPIDLWNRLQSRRWRHMSQEGLQEGESAGLPALREAIAAHLAAARGFDCSPNRILVTTSIPAGIDLAVRALGLTGSGAWIEDPSYVGDKQSLHNCGVQLLPLPVDSEGIDVGAGLKLGVAARMALVTPVAQFPTGATMSARRRQELLRWADANSAWIFEDDFGWSDAGAQAPRPLAAEGRSNVIYFNSFNHTLFPALRIAYVVLPPELIDRFLAVRKGLDGHPNVPNEMILADFIDGGHLDDHLRRCRESQHERREVLLRAIAEHLPHVLEPIGQPQGLHIICNLRGYEEEAFLARAAAVGVVVTAMNRLRLIAGPPQLLLGHSFPPEQLRKAAEILARVAG